jgi:hypothetical protein
LAERAELVFRPPPRVVKNESTGLAVQLLLFKQFSYSHSFDGLPSGVGQEKGETLLLKGMNAKFVRDVHQTLHIIPSNGALQMRIHEFEEIMESACALFLKDNNSVWFVG